MSSDHPDNDQSLEEQAWPLGAESGEQRCGGYHPDLQAERCQDLRHGLREKYKRDGQGRPDALRPENPFMAQGFGDIAIPYFYAEIRKQLKKRTPAEQVTIVVRHASRPYRFCDRLTVSGFDLACSERFRVRA